MTSVTQALSRGQLVLPGLCVTLFRRQQTAAMTARHWCFTSFSDSAPLYDDQRMYYLCYQHEICPNTGRIHLQGYVQFRSPVRMNAVKELLLDDAVHVEKSRGTPDEAREYCRKTDTAVTATFEEFGVLQHERQRNDLLSTKQYIEGVDSWRQVVLSDEHVSTVAPHMKWAKEVFVLSRPLPTLNLSSFYAWQSDLLGDLLQAPDPRSILWFSDSRGGVGKSTMARYLVIHHGAIILSGQKRDIHYAYNGQRIAIFDMARAASDYIPYEAIEDVKNGAFFCEKYESGMKIFAIPHVVVFANVDPAPGKFSPDRIVLQNAFPLTLDSDSDEDVQSISGKATLSILN